MTTSEQEIQVFATRVRQLLLKYKELQKELSDVKADLENQRQKAEEQQAMAKAAVRDYEMLMNAKMLQVSDGDIETARKRVNKLIRDVDRCITLLNEQQQK